MARHTMQTTPVAVEEELKVEWWRLSDLGAEYNIQNEFDQRFESLQAARVVDIPLSTEDLWGLTGWTPADSLAIHINAGELWCYPGVGHVGPSRYVRTADGDISLTPADNTYYIRLKYDVTIDAHSFVAEVSKSADTADMKYLTLAQATRFEGTWTTVDADLRSSNTSILPPVVFSGSSVNPILTLQQDGAGIALKINSGDVQLGQTGTAVAVTLYGTPSAALTLADSASTNTVDISCDASGRLKITGSINATETGTIIASSASVGGVTLNVGAMSGITTIVMSGQLTNTLTPGTAPFSIASTTKVTNLNVDQVDGYNFDQALLASSTPSFVTLALTQTTGTAPMTISSTTLVPNLNAELWDGIQFSSYFNQAVKTTSDPTFNDLTLTGDLTFDNALTATGLLVRHKVSGDTYMYGYFQEIDQTSQCTTSSVSVYHLYYDQITASPSSEKMKDNIVEADINLLSGYLDSVVPKNFVKKRRPNKQEVGIVAEDLPEIARTYDPDGKLAGYRPDVVMILMLAKLKTLQTEVNMLKTQLEGR